MDRQGFNNIGLIIVLLGIGTFSNAQELITNGNFNYFDECAPQSLSSSVDLEPWFWTFGSPDFLHPCFPASYSVPLSTGGGGQPILGEGYCGILSYSTSVTLREFVSIELNMALAQNVAYHVSFHVSMMDSIWYATRNIGVVFTPDEPPTALSALISLEPQVKYEGSGFLDNKEDWTKVEGSFTAQGGERYLTIGNFDTDEETDTLFVVGGGTPRNNLRYFGVEPIIT